MMKEEGRWSTTSAQSLHLSACNDFSLYRISASAGAPQLKIEQIAELE